MVLHLEQNFCKVNVSHTPTMYYNDVVGYSFGDVTSGALQV